jgi:hypothetical protein
MGDRMQYCGPEESRPNKRAMDNRLPAPSWNESLDENGR